MLQRSVHDLIDQSRGKKRSSGIMDEHDIGILRRRMQCGLHRRLPVFAPGYNIIQFRRGEGCQLTLHARDVVSWHGYDDAGRPWVLVEEANGATEQ